MKIAWSALLCLAASTSAASEEKRPVPSYTNEDLSRLSDRRGETGGSSETTPAAASSRSSERREPKGRGEPYWRREADRQRQRIEPLRRKLAELEDKLAERRRTPGVRPYSDPQVESYVAQLRSLRDRIREDEGRFEDRARREGALPGWLR